MSKVSNDKVRFSECCTDRKRYLFIFVRSNVVFLRNIWRRKLRIIKIYPSFIVKRHVIIIKKLYFFSKFNFFIKQFFPLLLWRIKVYYIEDNNRINCTRKNINLIYATNKQYLINNFIYLQAFMHSTVNSISYLVCSNSFIQ